MLLKKATLKVTTNVTKIFFLFEFYKWAAHCGTAMQRQPVAEPEQAPDIPPISKNQFDILAIRWIAYQISS